MTKSGGPRFWNHLRNLTENTWTKRLVSNSTVCQKLVNGCQKCWVKWKWPRDVQPNHSITMCIFLTLKGTKPHKYFVTNKHVFQSLHHRKMDVYFFLKHHISTGSHSWFHWSVVTQNNVLCSALGWKHSRMCQNFTACQVSRHNSSVILLFKKPFWGSWDTCNTASLPHLPSFFVASCFVHFLFSSFATLPPPSLCDWLTSRPEVWGHWHWCVPLVT